MRTHSPVPQDTVDHHDFLLLRCEDRRARTLLGRSALAPPQEPMARSLVLGSEVGKLSSLLVRQRQRLRPCVPDVRSAVFERLPTGLQLRSLLARKDVSERRPHLGPLCAPLLGVRIVQRSGPALLTQGLHLVAVLGAEGTELAFLVVGKVESTHHAVAQTLSDMPASFATISVVPAMGPALLEAILELIQLLARIRLAFIDGVRRGVAGTENQTDAEEENDGTGPGAWGCIEHGGS